MEKKLVFGFVLLTSFLLGVATSFAQDPTITKAVPEGAAEVTPDNIVEATITAVSDWQTAGWLVGVLGLVYVLVLLSKYGPLNKFLQDKGLKWIRPIVAAVYGGLMGGVTALSTGMGVPQVIITGLVAGLGSTGFHELLSVVCNKDERKKRS